MEPTEPTPPRIAVFGFALAGALFLFAALIPMIKGDDLNAAFFTLGIVFLILGLGVSRKRGRGANPPSAGDTSSPQDQ